MEKPSILTGRLTRCTLNSRSDGEWGASVSGVKREGRIDGSECYCVSPCVSRCNVDHVIIWGDVIIALIARIISLSRQICRYARFWLRFRVPRSPTRVISDRRVKIPRKPVALVPRRVAHQIPLHPLPTGSSALRTSAGHLLFGGRLVPYRDSLITSRGYPILVRVSTADSWLRPHGCSCSSHRPP